MPLTDRKVLTFDVVGTLIDFETGILDYVQGRSKTVSAAAILEAYAIAEDHQHHDTPRLPFPSMMAPMYREMAAKLGLPDAEDDVEGFRLSIPRWPAFPDSVAALKRLRKHFRLVAMTNSDNWALSHFANTLEQPFDDLVTAEMWAGTSPTRRSSPTPADGRAWRVSGSTTSCTSRKASTTTSRWPSAWAITSAGSSAARTSRAPAQPQRWRTSSSPTTTSQLSPNSPMRWMREVNSHLNSHHARARRGHLLRSPKRRWPCQARP